MEDYSRIAKEIYNYIGGIKNVKKIVFCMTRVRIDIINKEKVNIEKLKSIDGVLGVLFDDKLQIVVGPTLARKVAEEMVSISGYKIGENFEENELENSNEDINLQEKTKIGKEKFNKNYFYSRFLKSISNIFVPLLPAFIGAGLIAGLSGVLTNSFFVEKINNNFLLQFNTILSVIKNGIFSYLIIYVGIYSAREFGATESLGGTIGGVTALLGMNQENPIINIFTKEPLKSGQGGILGVIFAVYILSFIEKYLRKKVSNSFDILITPFISLLITGIITIFFIMPFAGFVSIKILSGINLILGLNSTLSGFLLATFFLPMVMLGLHHVLIPIHLELIMSSGSTFLLPILAMAGAGQVGASMALYLKLRNNKKYTKILEYIKGGLPVGMLGIGEPLIYGVTLPLGKPFITACIGGGIGGAVIGLLGNVGAVSIGPSGIALIPLILQGEKIKYIIGLFSGYLGGFIVTYLFGNPRE